MLFFIMTRESKKITSMSQPNHCTSDKDGASPITSSVTSAPLRSLHSDAWTLVCVDSEEESLLECWRTLPFDLPYSTFRQQILTLRRQHEQSRWRRAWEWSLWAWRWGVWLRSLQP